jgi:hypothetical protein
VKVYDDRIVDETHAARLLCVSSAETSKLFSRMSLARRLGGLIARSSPVVGGSIKTHA